VNVAIRPARVEDVDAIRALINRYAAEDRMLERSRDFLLEHLRDFLIAEDTSGFLGCCSLAVLTPDLAEVRSLAVHPEASGRGIGRQLVLACVAEARRHRDAPTVHASLAALRTAAAGTTPLMPLILAAVRARATLGEISDTLREVWGVYRAA